MRYNISINGLNKEIKFVKGCGYRAEQIAIEAIEIAPFFEKAAKKVHNLWV